jgi:hypothetical protein
MRAQVGRPYVFIVGVQAQLIARQRVNQALHLVIARQRVNQALNLVINTQRTRTSLTRSAMVHQQRSQRVRNRSHRRGIVHVAVESDCKPVHSAEVNQLLKARVGLGEHPHKPRKSLRWKKGGGV